MGNSKSSTSLTDWGWPGTLPESWSRSLQDQKLRPARITSEHRGAFEAITAEGTLRVEPKGRMRKGEIWPATGDWVALDGMQIESVLERVTCLKRKAAGESEDIQILACNIDWVFVTTSLNQDFNPRRIERFLVAARDSLAQVALVLTKADLGLMTVDEVRDSLAKRLGDIKIIITSSREGRGIDELRNLLKPNATAVFLGTSGVGKSSLVNAILKRDQQEVQAAREDDDKGRHTTTGRQSFLVPTGGVIIDTPGIRELQLAELDTSVEEEFRDIEELALRCKFTNCTHTKEKGCAIQTALNDGSLSGDRFESFKKLKEEAEARTKRTRR